MWHKQPKAVVALLLFLVQQSEGHGTMMKPVPRQPESLYWYQVGCMIGCKCSGGGKETYPTPQSVDCSTPGTPTITKASELTWNANGKSPMGSWNKYMPWRAPGTSIPLDACGIASGFSPSAKVQYPHKFKDGTKQGTKGTDLPVGDVTQWIAGSVVEASYRLVVNHGGGYQYRVCPKGNKTTEECFQANPLEFANGKTTVEYSTGKKITLDAVDVTTGVQPAGHAWRRLPIPACACDLGSSCQKTTLAAAKKGDYVAYATDGSLSKHGHCEFGLQFEAPHIKDGTWTDGFGYYVSKLGSEANKNSKDKCSPYTVYTCEKNGCTWHQSKNVCYTATTTKSSTSKDSCNAYTNQTKCDAKAANGCVWYAPKTTCYTPGCTELKTETACNASTRNCSWYASKKTCWDGSTKSTESDGKLDWTGKGGFGGAGTKDEVVHQWWMTDELKAPSKTGDYVLQWRWDNEQTPQIWTTCADIKVVTKPDTVTPSAAVLSRRGASIFLGIMLAEVVATMMY